MATLNFLNFVNATPRQRNLPNKALRSFVVTLVRNSMIDQYQWI